MPVRNLSQRRSLLALFAACGILLVPAPASGQTSAVVSGTVTDSTGAPVFGAEVSAAGVAFRTATDARGVFHLGSVPVGTASLSVRRMGFAPATISVAVSEGNSRVEGVRVTLTPLPSVLTPVRVVSQRVNYTGRLAGYYQRLEKRSGGYFITRDQIDRENPRTLSQLLLHVPGVTPYKGRAGSQSIRMRGRLCWPLVWIDGTPMPAGETDLDAFAPQTIHGIELYSGSTTAPARFILGRVDNSCGTVVLWSRGPDTDPITAVFRPVVDLNGLLASHTVFTADEVDAPAELAQSTFSVGYPQSLFAAGVGGTVTAEFVVDERGQVERETFGIVASSNPLLSQAVREAVFGAIFTPARRKGTVVRQLVQQPFTFVARRG